MLYRYWSSFHSETATSNVHLEPACLSNYFELVLRDYQPLPEYKIFNEHDDDKQSFNI